ncbi:MAG: tetratricopeptide repeat protein [Lachnospiraceae bacterium]|nr:tetratricopeptide repeat protein [Lachnospiraceae bacterium]
MFCYNCGNLLSEYDFCTSCGADVRMYKKIIYTSNRFYNEGLEKAKVRDLSGAVVSLRQSLKFDKNNIDARNLLGLVYFEMGEVGVALSEWLISQSKRSEKNVANEYIKLLQSSNARFTEMATAVEKYNIAYNYCLQGSKDLASIQIKGALSKNRQFSKAHLLLALLYMENEDWERAENEVRSCLKIDKGNTVAQRYQLEIEKMLEPEEGEKKTSHKNSGDVIRFKRDDELIIQPANVKEPKNTGIGTLVNILIGLVLGAAAVYFLVVPARVAQVNDEAQASIKEIGSQIDTKNSTIQDLENKIDSLTKEKTTLENVIEGYTGTGGTISEYDALMKVAGEYIVEKDNDKTAAALDELRENVDESTMSAEYQQLYQAILAAIGPSVAGNYYDEGMAAYHAENYETAIDKLTKASYYDKTNADALFTLGNAYRLMGNFDEARSIYEQVILTFPDTERARRSEQYIAEITAD